MPPKVWYQKKSMMVETLYKIITVYCEQEVEDDEKPPRPVLYQNTPRRYLEITTKHSFQTYTAYPCEMQLTISWPWKIHCGSMRQMSHDKCSHQTYIADLQLDNDHSHDQVQMWIYICIRIKRHQSQPGRRDDKNDISSYPRVFVTTKLVHFSSCE